MKGDFSRNTFDRLKHYRSVRMQQGRVQLDADWNEQADLIASRSERAAADIIGPTGAPKHDAGFSVYGGWSGDFSIGAGRYYVDGILVENDGELRYRAQPDYPGPAALGPGRHLVYLDVWLQHVAALDDASLREIALGGPDTTTRERVVWQVKAVPTTETDCDAAWARFQSDLGDRGRMSARAVPAEASDNPCLVAPASGYRGLENHLYRVEIHRPGPVMLTSPVGSDELIDVVETAERPVANAITVAGGASWDVGDAVQIVTDADPAHGPIYLVVGFAYLEAGIQLRLHARLAGVAIDATTRVRKLGAIFKWSRDNASFATAIRGIDERRWITVDSLGPDEVLGFAVGDLAEVLDEVDELVPEADFRPQLLEVVAIDPAGRRVQVIDTPSYPAWRVSSNRPRLRKWNGLGPVVRAGHREGEGGGEGQGHGGVGDDATGHELEDGLFVQFEGGSATRCRAGDHWLIPARASGTDGSPGLIQWPADGLVAPFGIDHHRTPLAIIDVGGEPNDHDCRRFFPPLTGLTSFFYLGGDGQEVKPDLSNPTSLAELPEPLRVGVANDDKPVEGARIRFTRVDALQGTIVGVGAAVEPLGPETVIVTTGPDGIAQCRWALRGPAAAGHRVVAELLDNHNPQLVHHLPITFSARRSVAAEVAFDAAGCPGLAAHKDVQDALMAVAHDRALAAIGGDGQDGLHGAVLSLPLEIEVRDACGPVAGATVQCWLPGWAGSAASTVGGVALTASDAAQAGPMLTLTTDADGRARAFWRLGAGAAGARRGAREAGFDLLAGGPGTAVVRSVRFTANSVESCGERTARNADELIAILADVQNQPIDVSGAVHICLAPGKYLLDAPIQVVGGGRHLKITGSGPGTQLLAAHSGALFFNSFASLTLRDFAVEAKFETSTPAQSGAIILDGCERSVVEHLRLSVAKGNAREHACVRVRGGGASIRVRACDLSVGDDQVGLAIENIGRVEIEDNTITALEGHTIGQAMILAGKGMPEIRIVDNTIRGAAQGIHIRRTVLEEIERTLITGNTIALRIRSGTVADAPARAISCAAAASIVIEDNLITVDRGPRPAAGSPPQAWQLQRAEGIHIEFDRGALMIVERNHSENATVGVFIRSGTPAVVIPTEQYQWKYKPNAWRMDTLYQQPANDRAHDIDFEF